MIRNQTLASLRAISVFIYADDGTPASATTSFVSSGELLYDPGTGVIFQLT